MNPTLQKVTVAIAVLILFTVIVLVRVSWDIWFIRQVCAP